MNEPQVKILVELCENDGAICLRIVRTGQYNLPRLAVLMVTLRRICQDLADQAEKNGISRLELAALAAAYDTEGASIELTEGGGAADA